METTFVGGELVVLFHTNQPILVTKESDIELYEILESLLKNRYIFDNSSLSYQTENKIVWFSDQTCDIDNIEETNKVNRLIIEKKNDEIHLFCKNPFFEMNEIIRKTYVIAFSSSGNGQYSKNLITSLTFQDDVAVLFQELSLSSKTKILTKSNNI